MTAPQTPDREQEIPARAEALALAAWEKCTLGDGGCVYDDPRNIAVAVLPVLDTAVAAAVRRALEDVAAWLAEHGEANAAYLMRTCDLPAATAAAPDREQGEGGCPAPSPMSSAHELADQQRAALEAGYTDQAWAVDWVLCPAREKCSTGRLNSLFRPLKDGRLPMHRNNWGQACSGAHKKPVTPPLKLRVTSEQEATR